MDGRAYLEKLITDRLGQDHLDRSEIRGVAIGLAAAGALPEQDLEQALADLDATLLRTGRMKIVRLGDSGSARISATPVAKRVGAERPDWQQAAQDPPTPVLRDVVALVGRTLTVGESTANLISLEVWSTSVALTMAFIGLDPHRMRQRFEPHLRWRGWDDVGTQYQGGGGGASGSPAFLVARNVLAPGPPAQARVLTLVVEHPSGQAEVSIPLA